jgi:hypothetical protein
MARPARWGTRTLRASRSHARHDHKHDDHDARGHAGQITSRKVSQSHFVMAMDNVARIPQGMYLGYTCRVPPVYLGGGTRRPAANLTSARAPGHPAPGWGLGPLAAAQQWRGRCQVGGRSTSGLREVPGRSPGGPWTCLQIHEVPGVKNTARNPICVSRRIVPPGRLGCRPPGAGRSPGAASHAGTVRLAAWRRTCDCGPARRSLSRSVTERGS